MNQDLHAHLQKTKPPVRLLATLLTVLFLSYSPVPAQAHGGVVLEDDQCLIKVGYLKAHFKIYLPRIRRHEEFCEDLPSAGETLFVMEYLHSGFSEVPIDFRIVRNVTGLGRFARWTDVAAAGDLEAITVFHRPAAPAPDVFTAVVDLTAPGEYIGIVTALHPEGHKDYQAVFPFTVGFNGLGIWPWLALFIVYVLGNVWILLRRGMPSAALSSPG